MKRRFLFTLLSAAWIVSSCTEENITTLSNPDSTINLDNVTYTSHVKNAIDAQCISCHGSINPSGDLDISTYTTAKNNINSIISRIDLQTGQAGIMPPSGRMTETNIQLFKNWLSQGLLE
jgi:uncharacterized membrane protein